MYTFEYYCIKTKTKNLAKQPTKIDNHQKTTVTQRADFSTTASLPSKLWDAFVNAVSQNLQSAKLAFKNRVEMKAFSE